MNKHESKYFSTAFLMDEALINLLDKKDIKYITVKEICEKAGVNRSTFYLHYESINDLVEEAMDYVNKKFVDCFKLDVNGFLNNINNSSLKDLYLINEKYLIPYLEFVKENKMIFKASFNNPSGMDVHNKYSDLKKHVLVPILKRYNVKDSDMNYYLGFYISGIMAIIKEWIINDCKDDLTNVVNMIIKCVNKDYI